MGSVVTERLEGGGLKPVKRRLRALGHPREAISIGVIIILRVYDFVSFENFLWPKERGMWSLCLRTWLLSQAGLY